MQNGGDLRVKTWPLLAILDFLAVRVYGIGGVPFLVLASRDMLICMV